MPSLKSETGEKCIVRAIVFHTALILGLSYPVEIPLTRTNETVGKMDRSLGTGWYPVNDLKIIAKQMLVVTVF